MSASGDGPTKPAKKPAGRDDYIEMFYNPVCKQVRIGMLSLMEFEQQRILKAKGD